MNRISASEKSDLTLIAALFFLLLLYVAYNAHFEKKVPGTQEETKAVVAGENPCMTQL